MKRLLMATAAAIALAIAAPLATAQYTTPPPAQAPYTTPVPEEPTTPQDETLSQQPDMQPSEPAPPPTPDMTQEQTAQDQTTAEPTYGPTETYADSGMGANVATPASLEQHARDAGMDGLPMSPQEVCMQREFTLTNSGTSLPRDKEHQLINAADRASVCEIQRVVIHSPNGRAEEARRLLVANDVDANLIEVQDSDMPGLHVQMDFAGIATSSEQYAQMFNVQQVASYQPSTTAPSYAPSTTAPPVEPSTPDATTEPMPPPVEEPSMQTPEPNSDPMDDMEDDSMSPTSGEPAVGPELYDI
jgi:hypothetical protein